VVAPLAHRCASGIVLDVGAEKALDRDLPQVAFPPALARSSTSFLDNMAQPVHRWLRYLAGFSAAGSSRYVESARSASPRPPSLVLEPFLLASKATGADS
jgi:hypothetical protein